MTTEVGQYVPQARPPMDEAEAREFVKWARVTQDELVQRVYEAYNRQAHLALGYASWEDMCVGEGLGFYRLPADKRKPAVIQLRSLGVSNRAIGSALGVDEKTVRNDIRSTESVQTNAEYSAPNDQEDAVIEGVVTDHPQGFGTQDDEVSYPGVTIDPEVRTRLISARSHLRKAKNVLTGSEREFKDRVLQLITDVNNTLAGVPRQ